MQDLFKIIEKQVLVQGVPHYIRSSMGKKFRFSEAEFKEFKPGLNPPKPGLN